jgi:hypothetical protein
MEATAKRFDKFLEKTVRCSSLSISQRSLATNESQPMIIQRAAKCTLPVFQQKFALEDDIDPTPLLRLKRCHACAQCHSSRVFTASVNTSGRTGRCI